MHVWEILCHKGILCSVPSRPVRFLPFYIIVMTFLVLGLLAHPHSHRPSVSRAHPPSPFATHVKSLV